MNCETCRQKIKIGIPVKTEGTLYDDRNSVICIKCFVQALFTAKEVLEEDEHAQLVET